LIIIYGNSVFELAVFGLQLAVNIAQTANLQQAMHGVQTANCPPQTYR
jgi:hypothetical protein